MRVRLSAEGCSTEIPRFPRAFPKHLLTSQTREGPKVALQWPFLSDAVDLADLVRMAEALHLQWVAGAARGGEFEYLFTWRLVLGSKKGNCVVRHLIKLRRVVAQCTDPNPLLMAPGTKLTLGRIARAGEDRSP